MSSAFGPRNGAFGSGRLWLAAGGILFALLLPHLITSAQPSWQAVGPKMWGVLFAALPFCLAVRYCEQGSPWQIWICAVVLRVPLLFLDPTFSDDLYRYLWDGRVQWAGIQPYLYAPSDPALAGLRDLEIFPRVNHPDIPTVYPPVAQWLFALAHLFGGRVLSWKLLVVAFDLLTLGLLMGVLRRRELPRGSAIVYGWHPLVLTEFALDGHMDALAIALLVAALCCRPPGAAVALTLSAMSKLFAFALVPAFLRRHPRSTAVIVPLVVGLACAPYVGLGSRSLDGLWAYGSRWKAHAVGYALVEEISAQTCAVDADAPWRAQACARRRARLAVIAAFGALALLLAWQGVGMWQATFLLVVGFLVLSPTVHPWYGVWLVPFLALRFSRPWLLLTLLLPLSYFNLGEWLDPSRGTWSEPVAVKIAIWGPFLLIGAAEIVSRKLDRLRACR